MQDNIHNKNVEERLKDFTMDPSGLVWDGVEKNLDKKKRRYIIGWWMLLPLLLIGTGLFLFVGNDNKKEGGSAVQTKSSDKNIQQATNTTAQNTGATISEKKNTSDKVEPAVTPLKEKSTQKNRTGNIDLAGNSSAGYNKKTKKAFTKSKAGSKTDDDIASASPVLLNDKGRMTARVESPQPSGVDTTSALQSNTDSLPGNKLAASKKQPVAENSDTSKNTTGKAKDKNKPRKHWQKEWTANAGASELAGLNIFSNQEILYYNGGVGSSPSIRTREQYDIKPGMSAGARIQLVKKLSPRFSFRTGIGYLYNSVNIKTTLITDSLLLGTSADLYTTLSIVSHKSKLHLHNINIPLLLTYSFPKAKIDITGGLQNHFVVAGNWKEHASLLGKKKFYMPSVYLNPTVAFRQFNVGPYLNTGLQTFDGNKRLMEFGLNIRAPF